MSEEKSGFSHYTVLNILDFIELRILTDGIEVHVDGEYKGTLSESDKNCIAQILINE